MIRPTPRLEIHTDRISENLRAIVGQCAEHSVQVAAVTKVLGAHPALLAALPNTGVSMVADSRLTNLERVAAADLGLPTLLLRPPAPRTAARTVQVADVSLNSSLVTMQALSEAAEMIGTRHGVIVMVDVGDLREGVWPDHVVDLVSQASRLPGLDILGLGTNLACYGGVIPTADKLELISGGNSANLPLMVSGQMPAQINQLRIGEAAILGRNTLDRSAWPGTRQDTAELVTEVVELERKPSIPQGERGQDAFGQTVKFVDRGVRLRAICDLGRQDVAPEDLTPVDPGHIVLGASSDHLIIDVTDGDTTLRVGSEIRLRPTYGGLLTASTCADVWKTSADER